MINALQQATKTKCGRAAIRKDKGSFYGRKNFEFKIINKAKICAAHPPLEPRSPESVLI